MSSSVQTLQTASPSTFNITYTPLLLSHHHITLTAEYRGWVRKGSISFFIQQYLAHFRFHPPGKYVGKVQDVWKIRQARLTTVIYLRLSVMYIYSALHVLITLVYKQITHITSINRLRP